MFLYSTFLHEWWSHNDLAIKALGHIYSAYCAFITEQIKLLEWDGTVIQLVYTRTILMISTPSYYHQIRNINHLPSFRARSWEDVKYSMFCYVLIDIICFKYVKCICQTKYMFLFWRSCLTVYKKFFTIMTKIKYQWIKTKSSPHSQCQYPKSIIFPIIPENLYYKSHKILRQMFLVFSCSCVCPIHKIDPVIKAPQFILAWYWHLLCCTPC